MRTNPVSVFRRQRARVGWYLARLRTMSPAEVGWRARRVAATALVRARHGTSRSVDGPADPRTAFGEFGRAAGRPVLLDRDRAGALAAEWPEGAVALLAAADDARAGRFAFFGYPVVELGPTPDWNLDPIAGVRWPDAPADRIDHRVFPADPKWIWELNRLQHLPVLAQAWLMTGDDRYAATALAHLDSWIDANPVGRGIAWRGAFEAGIRAVSVSVALAGLRDYEGLTFDRYLRVLRVLAASADRCWQERSRYSSANNHLVGELAGAATIGLVFPELPGAARRLDDVLAALSREAGLQILADGSGAEQAPAYQVFTAELLLVVAVQLRSVGRPVPTPIIDALRRDGRFLARLVGDHDPDPRYGDDDEGIALRLDGAPLRTVRSHLAAIAAFTGDGLAARSGRADLASAWVGRQPRPSAEEPASFHAAHGGLVVLRSGERRITMDVGPLGYLSIAAHGHADALALTVDTGGEELVGDPGAASYYGHPAWRAVHRGTAAHATVTVDGADQSVAGGPFMWTRHAAVRVRRVALDRGVVDAEHDGYGRRASPVRHRRWLVAPPGGDVVAVVDLVDGAGDQVRRVRSAWPCAPDVVAAPSHGAAHLVTAGDRPALRVLHAATGPHRTYLLRAEVGSGRGWWSRRLESREPAAVLGTELAAPLPVVLTTLFSFRPGPGATTDPVVEHADGRVVVRWNDGVHERWISIDTSGDGAVSGDLMPDT